MEVPVDCGTQHSADKAAVAGWADALFDTYQLERAGLSHLVELDLDLGKAHIVGDGHLTLPLHCCACFDAGIDAVAESHTR